MKSLITKTIISVFIFFIILSFLILNSNKKTQIKSIEEEHEVDKQDTYLYLYDIVVIIFLFTLIFFIIYNGYIKGCIMSLFVWSFFVACTPIPEAGLLISLPLKKYFNISLHICQTFVSLIAIGMLYYFYLYEKTNIIKCIVGKLFLGLINLKYFSIIIISTISSILTSELIDNVINNYIYKENIEYINIKISIIGIFVLVYTYLLNLLINKINKN